MSTFEPDYVCSCPPWVRKCEPDCPSLIAPELRAKTEIRCPKCNWVSGDDWEQCDGKCPMTCSPHYDDLTAHAFQLIPLPRE